MNGMDTYLMKDLSILLMVLNSDMNKEEKENE